MGPRRMMLLAALLPLVLGTWPAGADWTWAQSTATTLDLDGAAVDLGRVEERVSIKSNLARVDEVSRSGARIYNFQNQQVVLLNFAAKSYVQLGISDLIREGQRVRAEVKASLDQTERMAREMPTDQARMNLAQVAAQRKKYELWDTGVYSIRPTAEKKDVAGHPCVKYEGRSNDEVFQEFWVAEDLPLDPEFKRFFAAGMVALDPQQNTSWAQLPGLPLRTITRYGPVTVTDEITNPRNDPVPVSAFLIPEDFKEAETKVESGQ